MSAAEKMHDPPPVRVLRALIGKPVLLICPDRSIVGVIRQIHADDGTIDVALSSGVVQRVPRCTPENAARSNAVWVWPSREKTA